MDNGRPFVSFVWLSWVLLPLPGGLNSKSVCVMK